MTSVGVRQDWQPSWSLLDHPRQTQNTEAHPDSKLESCFVLTRKHRHVKPKAKWFAHCVCCFSNEGQLSLSDWKGTQGIQELREWASGGEGEREEKGLRLGNLLLCRIRTGFWGPTGQQLIVSRARNVAGSLQVWTCSSPAKSKVRKHKMSWEDKIWRRILISDLKNHQPKVSGERERGQENIWDRKVEVLQQKNRKMFVGISRKKQRRLQSSEKKREKGSYLEKAKKHL